MIIIYLNWYFLDSCKCYVELSFSRLFLCLLHIARLIYFAFEINVWIELKLLLVEICSCMKVYFFYKYYVLYNERHFSFKKNSLRANNHPVDIQRRVVL